MPQTQWRNWSSVGNSTSKDLSPIAFVVGGAYPYGNKWGAVQVKHYLERMKIGDVKRLADQLDMPTTSLLEASRCLSENITDRHVESICDLAELGDTNVPLPI